MKVLTVTDLQREFARILNRPDVRADDDFFTLGGDSLLAAQLIVGLRRSFGGDLDIVDLLDCPTPRSLADILKGRSAEGEAYSGLVQKNLTEGPVSILQQERLSIWRSLPNARVLSRIQIVHGSIERHVFEDATQDLIDRHSSLRTGFSLLEEGPHKATIFPTAIANVHWYDFSNLILSTTEVRELGMEVAERLAAVPFELSEPPLIRFAVIRLTPHSSLVAVFVEHLVADSESVDICIAELAEIYNSRIQDRPSSLKRLEFEYLDFASWQNERLQGSRLDTLVGYWANEIRTTSIYNGVPIPGWHYRDSADVPSPAVMRRVIRASAASHSILAGQALGLTPFMTTAALLAISVSEVYGHTEVPLVTPIRNRPEGADGMVGWFAHVVGFQIPIETSMVDTMASARNAIASATKNGELVHYLLPKLLPEDSRPGSARRGPNIFLNYQSVNQSIDWNGFSVEDVEPRPTAVSFAGLAVSVSIGINDLNVEFTYGDGDWPMESLTALLETFVRLLQAESW